MSTEENKRLAREAIGIWSSGDPDDPHDLHGVEAMKDFVSEFRRAFPDFHDSIDIQVAEGDTVATRFTSLGTHEGPFMGVEPTGKNLTWTGTSIDRISGGKIAESWANWDMMGMMQQLGAVSAAGQNPE